MRWLHLLARIIGWLLTPLVVWAASLYGAWLTLAAQSRFENPRHAVLAALAVALVVAVVAMLGWLALLRRSPRLRHSLHLNREGIPVLEDAPADPGTEGPP